MTQKLLSLTTVTRQDLLHSKFCKTTTRDSKVGSSMKFITFVIFVLSLLLTVSGKKWRLSSANDCRAALKYENGKMMTYVSDSKTHSFTRAREICEEIGGSLPIIHSQDTLDFLTDTLFPQNRSLHSSRTWSSSGIWLGRKTINSTLETASCSTEWLDGSPVDFEIKEFGGGCEHQCNNTDCCAMYVSAGKKYYKKASFGNCNLVRAYVVCVIPGNYISLMEEADSTHRFFRPFHYSNCDLKDRMEKARQNVSRTEPRRTTSMYSTPPSWAHIEGCKSVIVSQDNSNKTILIDNRKPGATFNETLKWCTDLGGHLPMIRNFEEYNIIKRTVLDLTDSSHLWLGWHPIANTTNCTSSWMDGSPAFNIADFSFLSPIQSDDDLDSGYYVHIFHNLGRTSSPLFQHKSTFNPFRSKIKLLSSCEQCSYDDCCALQTSYDGATFGSCEENLRKVCVIPGDFMLSQSNPEATAGCNYIDIHDPVVITTTTTQEPITGIDIINDDDYENEETTRSGKSTLESTTMSNEEPVTDHLTSSTSEKMDVYQSYMPSSYHYSSIVSNIVICVTCSFLVFIALKIHRLIKRQRWSRSPVSAEYSEQGVTLSEWNSCEPLTQNL